VLAVLVPGLAAYAMCRSGPRQAETEWRWRPAAAMAHARFATGLVSLRDGRVLACGGGDRAYKPLTSCEIYDPRADRWLPAAAMDRPNGGSLMVRLTDGRVLAVGGSSPGPDGITAAAIYDPGRDRWTPIAGVPRSATNASLTALPTGGAILVGGSYHGNDVFDDTFVLDVTSGEWSAGPSLNLGREAHCAGWTRDGLIVVGGRGQFETCWPSRWLCLRGGSSPQLASVERWTPGDRQWRRGRASLTPLPYCHGISLGDNELLVAADDRSVRYDASRDRWTEIAAPPRSLSHRTLAALPGGGAVAAGGYPYSGAPSRLASLVIDSGGRAWRWGAPVLRMRTSTTAATLLDGRVMLVGGVDEQGVTASVEIFGP